MTDGSFWTRIEGEGSADTVTVSVLVVTVGPVVVIYAPTVIVGSVEVDTSTLDFSIVGLEKVGSIISNDALGTSIVDYDSTFDSLVVVEIFGVDIVEVVIVVSFFAVVTFGPVF